MRVFQEAELEAPSPSARPMPRVQPRLSAEAAALHKVELAEMKRILQAQNVRLPAERFDDTNAELLRFATSAGLLQVSHAALHMACSFHLTGTCIWTSYGGRMH